MATQNFEQWLSELIKLGSNLTKEQLECQSPWENLTIGQSLLPEYSEYWVDRFAAWYSPSFALMMACKFSDQEYKDEK